MEERNEEIVKSPIFYMGNKYKLLNQLLPLFPKNIDTLYDLFGGSGCVSVNTPVQNVVYNELNDNIVKLFKMFIEHTPDEIDSKIRKYIDDYDLNKEGTDIRQNVPDIKEVREYYNKKYLEFRRAYNASDRNYIMLYTLTFYSFSNLIRFNRKGEFNMPFGNRCYCDKHYDNMLLWYDKVKNKNITIKQDDAFNVLNNTTFTHNDFIYLDPPYSNTLAIYNEKRAYGGWTIEDDFKLFEILEALDKKGIKWGMSNVFVNKKETNKHLIEWCEKNNWHVYHLSHTYASLGKGNGNSDEVYICNYKEE